MFGTLDIYSSVTIRYINRCWHYTNEEFVRWSTYEPDPSGSYYPGPGTFGTDTTSPAVLESTKTE